MSDHESDDERVAAFLDGRMDARRREEMMAHLTRSAEDREVLARTAALLRQMEEADAAPGEAPAPAAGPEAADPAAPEGVIPLDTRRTSRSDAGVEVRRTRGPVLRWMALAAVLACVALATGVLRPRSSAGEEPVRLAARLEHGAEGLPPRWTEEWPWTSARGDDPGGDRVATSARAGAMLVDLAVAVEAGDPEATGVLADQIAARFDRQGGRSGALRAIADSAGASPGRLRALVGEATERIEKRLDRDALRLGAWIEAARLAAARRDAAFFREGETRRRLDQAGRLTEADPAVQEVRRSLAADPPPWEALASALDAMMREIASE